MLFPGRKLVSGNKSVLSTLSKKAEPQGMAGRARGAASIPADIHPETEEASF